MVTPELKTAAIMMLAVPVTEASSRSIYVPFIFLPPERLKARRSLS